MTKPSDLAHVLAFLCSTSSGVRNSINLNTTNIKAIIIVALGVLSSSCTYPKAKVHVAFPEAQTRLRSADRGLLGSHALDSSTMPAERRTLRSSKDATSPTNGENPRSDSQNATSNKDMPVPTRTTSSKGRVVHTRKGSTNTVAKDLNNEIPKTNGSEPTENGVHNSEDVEMADELTDKTKPHANKEIEEEMTVVVPPPNSSKLSAAPEKDGQGDVAMIEEIPLPNAEAYIEVVDPKLKAIQGELFLRISRTLE